MNTWMLAGSLAAAAAAVAPASAQQGFLPVGATVKDHNGRIINGVIAPFATYQAPRMDTTWVLPSYVIYYQAPQPLFVPVAPPRPAVETLPVTTLTLRTGTAPREARVKAGAVVTWVNGEGRERTLVLKPSELEQENGPATPLTSRIAPNGSVSLVFHQPGVYEYHAQDAPDQRARIVVTQ